MKPHARKTRIHVIDRQDYWRELAVRTLTEAGFSVRSFDSYSYPPSNGLPYVDDPDLIVLGCASVGPEESNLIASIVERKDHLLVLSTSLPWRVMRASFLAGADDVADKPYDPNRLLAIVTQALESSRPRNSYEILRREAVR